MRSAKLVAIACLALLCVGAIGAGSAQAAKFRSEVSSTVLSAAQQTLNEFDFENPYGASFNCSEATASGLMSGSTAEKLVLAPTYDSCEYVGLPLASWSMNGCEYSFTVTGSSPNDGFMQLVCPAGKSVQMKFQLSVSTYCTVTVPAQAGFLVDYTNEGSASTRRVLMTSTATGMRYVVQYVGAGSYCGKAGEHADGKYTGSILVKGFQKGEKELTQVGLWVE